MVVAEPRESPRTKMQLVREITLFWSLSRGVRREEITKLEARKTIDYILSSELTSSWLRAKTLELHDLNNYRSN